MPLLKSVVNVKLNMEMAAAAEIVEIACRIRPDQCTLVPVRPGEITSQAGWALDTDPAFIEDVVARLGAAGVRVSLFVEAAEPAVRWAAARGADRVELYTEPFARAFASSADEARERSGGDRPGAAGARQM